MCDAGGHEVNGPGAVSDQDDGRRLLRLPTKGKGGALMPRGIVPYTTTGTCWDNEENLNTLQSDNTL